MTDPGRITGLDAEMDRLCAVVNRFPWPWRWVSQWRAGTRILALNAEAGV